MERRLGGGGMAEVFSAALQGAEGFRRRVAIKRILPRHSGDRAFAKMFIREARLSSYMSHANIVSVLDFDRDEKGRLFLAMEYVAGADLKRLMRTGPVPPAAAIYIATAVLRGLGYVHSLVRHGKPLGIVHRDVSPHNVLLSWDGAVKLSDFGVAKAYAATGVPRSPMLKGKLRYMSPEQLHGEWLDGRSDLFSLGVVLYEMLTGQRLFCGATIAEIIGRVLHQPIAPLRCLDAGLPRDLENAVMRLLQRDRGCRYATAQEASAALSRCAAATPAGAEELADLMRRRLDRDAASQAWRHEEETPTLCRAAGIHSDAAVTANLLGARRLEGRNRVGQVRAPSRSLAAAAAAGPVPANSPAHGIEPPGHTLSLPTPGGLLLMGCGSYQPASAPDRGAVDPAISGQVPARTP